MAQPVGKQQATHNKPPPRAIRRTEGRWRQIRKQETMPDVERAGAWGSDLAADVLEEMLIALLEHLV
jgi:hypothetical protein